LVGKRPHLRYGNHTHDCRPDVKGVVAPAKIKVSEEKPTENYIRENDYVGY
jgi:hypothetical protein